MNTDNPQTVQEKIVQMTRALGYSFAFSTDGYDPKNQSYNGMQAWQCDKSPEYQGVAFVYIKDDLDIEEYDANCPLFWELVDAEFFVTPDGNVEYFTTDNQKSTKP